MTLISRSSNSAWTSSGSFCRSSKIFLETLRLSHHHPAVQPAQNGGLLVLREIDARCCVRSSSSSRCRVVPSPASSLFRLCSDAPSRWAMAANSSAIRRGGKNEIHHPGGDGAARHAIELGGLVLGEGDSALRLDAFQPQGAVGGRAREHYSHCIGVELSARELKKESMGLNSLAESRAAPRESACRRESASDCLEG